MIKFCKKCQETKQWNCPSGYYFAWKDSVTHCPNCGYELIDIDFPAQDLAIIEDISNDVDFIESMIKLHDSDPIEYQLKLSQFKANLSQTKAVEENNVPKCPYCHSTNIKKITTTAKAVNTALFGIFGQKRKYQWHCNNCGSDF